MTGRGWIYLEMAGNGNDNDDGNEDNDGEESNGLALSEF